MSRIVKLWNLFWDEAYEFGGDTRIAYRVLKDKYGATDEELTEIWEMCAGLREIEEG